MVRKAYDWAQGAVLEPHSQKKHTILHDYFRKYLLTRCQSPHPKEFRLAVVDAFAGGGAYDCGAVGSPVIFIEVLRDTLVEINQHRAAEGFNSLKFRCLLIFNDAYADAYQQLQEVCAPYLGAIRENHPHLEIETVFLNEKFEAALGKIFAHIKSSGHGNILFNLDQYGHSQVSVKTIQQLMATSESVEIFLTFAIEAFCAYLSADEEKNRVSLNGFDALENLKKALENGDLINKPEWLARTEKSVFETWRNCAAFVSPFSIHNPEGWRYWFMHFANKSRARQVYNDVLHDNSSHQAHFGRAGLNMLAFDPSRETGTLSLFDTDSRANERPQLFVDIPQLLEKHGNIMTVEAFYAASYNSTAAHSEDINAMAIENPDIWVLTDNGRRRRKPNTIKPTDRIQLVRQKSFFQAFGFRGDKKD